MRLKCLLILFSLLTTQSYAYSLAGHPYLGGNIGATIGKAGQTYPVIQYTSSGAQIVDYYPISNNHSSTAVGGLNGGYEFLGCGGWQPAIALGVGAYQTGQFAIKGQIQEAALPDPATTLYNYKYNISSTRVVAEGKLTWLFGHLAPFINVGLGTSWNRSEDFNESAIASGGYVALSPFQSRIHAELTYTAGFGVGCAFNYGKSSNPFQRERLSLGYQYVDLGLASLGTRGSSYPYQLNVGRFTTYEVYLNYTHLFF